MSKQMKKELKQGRCFYCVKDNKDAPVLPREKLFVHKAMPHLLLCQYHYEQVDSLT